jgi:hypothetical protein
VKKLELIIRDKAVGLLEDHLEAINQMCRAPNDPLAPEGLTLWPSDKDLEELSRAIRDLASSYSRGAGSTWSCILAVQNKRPSLKLRKRVEDLVDRALKLSGKLPRAIEIHRQAMAGSEAAMSCFADLGTCFDGRAEIMSINWDMHSAILAPSAAKGESYRERAAQICIDVLRWSYTIRHPASTIMIWLMEIGNLGLAKKLDYVGSTHFYLLDEILERRKEGRRKKRAALRQKKRRLKDKEIALG